MNERVRTNGEFCRINIITPRADDTRDFFAALLGWAYGPIPNGVGYRIRVAGFEIGGLFEYNAPGSPVGIGVMVKTDDADTTSARVRDFGGDATPVKELGPAGNPFARMADCTDPTGAHFDLWQPVRNPGMLVSDREHGAPGWFETMTSDAPRATAFYEALFGWTSRTAPAGRTPAYTTFFEGEAPVAGLIPITPQMGAIPPHWAVYFTVHDVDVSAALAASLGATVHLPLMDIDGVGRMCGIISPEGVMCYLITYTT